MYVCYIIKIAFENSQLSSLIEILSSAEFAVRKVPQMTSIVTARLIFGFVSVEISEAIKPTE